MCCALLKAARGHRPARGCGRSLRHLCSFFLVRSQTWGNGGTFLTKVASTGLEQRLEAMAAPRARRAGGQDRERSWGSAGGQGTPSPGRPGAAAAAPCARRAECRVGTGPCRGRGGGAPSPRNRALPAWDAHFGVRHGVPCPPVSSFAQHGYRKAAERPSAPDQRGSECGPGPRATAPAGNHSPVADFSPQKISLCEFTVFLRRHEFHLKKICKSREKTLNCAFLSAKNKTGCWKSNYDGRPITRQGDKRRFLRHIVLFLHNIGI